jgi:hypothetical protein
MVSGGRASREEAMVAARRIIPHSPDDVAILSALDTILI